MGKPSIYSKTRRELRRDLALAGRIARPEKEIEVLAASIDAAGKAVRSVAENGEETG